MLHVTKNRENAVGRVGTVLCAAMLAFSAGAVSSCGNAPQKPMTESTAQRVFATPADAGAAFLEAAKSGDQAALLACRRILPASARSLAEGQAAERAGFPAVWAGEAHQQSVKRFFRKGG